MEFNFNRFLFRDVKPTDADAIADIELLCFPPNEACKREVMAERIKAAPSSLLVAYDRVNSTIAGFLSGIANDEETFRDAFFTEPSLHKEDGKTVFLLSLAVRPEYRHRGLASTIMDHYIEREEEKGRKKIVLTCHEELVEFYEGLGYEDLGIGNSNWGNEKWHDMQIELKD